MHARDAVVIALAVDDFHRNHPAQLNVRVPASLKRRVEGEAFFSDRKIVEVVQEALESYLEPREEERGGLGP